MWSEAETQFVIDNANILSDIQIAAILSRVSGKIVTPKAVTRKRNRLKIKKSAGWDAKVIQDASGIRP